MFLIMAGTPPIQAAPQGFMEGHLKIVEIRAVEPDNLPPPGNYAEYPLVVLSQDGKKEIARLTADKSGNYRVALPPGAYILVPQKPQAEERAVQGIHAKPQPFTIVPNQTVHVDISVFVGPAKGQASV